MPEAIDAFPSMMIRMPSSPSLSTSIDEGGGRPKASEKAALPLLSVVHEVPSSAMTASLISSADDSPEPASARPMNRMAMEATTAADKTMAMARRSRVDIRQCSHSRSWMQEPLSCIAPTREPRNCLHCIRHAIIFGKGDMV